MNDLKPKPVTIVSSPWDLSEANKAIEDAQKKGWYTIPIEFTVLADDRLAVSMRFRRQDKKVRRCVVTTQVEKWTGKTSSNHPVLNFGGTLYYYGIE